MEEELRKIAKNIAEFMGSLITRRVYVAIAGSKGDIFYKDGQPIFYADLSASAEVTLPENYGNIQVNTYDTNNITDIEYIPTEYISITASDSGSIYCEPIAVRNNLDISGTF